MISVSTTGFTAHLNSSGKIEEELPQFQSGNLISELTTYEGRTTASRIGSWFWFIIGALGIGARGLNLMIKSR
jgi:apolipoprotein N-acyltransferase